MNKPHYYPFTYYPEGKYSHEVYHFTCEAEWNRYLKSEEEHYRSHMTKKDSMIIGSIIIIGVLVIVAITRAIKYLM